MLITGPTKVYNKAGYNILTGNNTYTGGTTVEGGTLVSPATTPSVAPPRSRTARCRFPAATPSSMNPAATCALATTAPSMSRTEPPPISTAAPSSARIPMVPPPSSADRAALGPWTANYHRRRERRPGQHAGGFRRKPHRQSAVHFWIGSSTFSNLTVDGSGSSVTLGSGRCWSARLAATPSSHPKWAPPSLRPAARSA